MSDLPLIDKNEACAVRFVANAVDLMTALHVDLAQLHADLLALNALLVAGITVHVR